MADEPKKDELETLQARVKELEKKLGLDKPKPTKEQVLRTRKRS